MFRELYRWTIRARVTSKFDIKEWSKREGRLFVVHLIDESVSTLCSIRSAVLVKEWLVHVICRDFLASGWMVLNSRLVFRRWNLRKQVYIHF
jgi:hypothetical protein